MFEMFLEMELLLTQQPELSLSAVLLVGAFCLRVLWPAKEDPTRQ